MTGNTAPPGASLLKVARILRGLDQGQLAEVAGVTRWTVNRVEAGVIAPRLTTARALAGALGFDVIALFPAEGGAATPERVSDLVATAQGGVTA